MKIALIFRSKERNEFSIEALFESMKKYIRSNYEIEDKYLPCGRYNRLFLLLKNIHAAKRIKADIYHITGEVNFVAGVLPASKTIITVHDFVDLDNMNNGLKKAIRWLFWNYIPMKHCKYIACVSNKTLQDMIKRFPFTKNKAIYIPNPIDDSYVKVDKNFDIDCPRILVVGTRVNKNLERIIEAVKEIKCKLFIIGVLNDNQKGLLNKYSIKYKNVFHISDEEVRKAYCDCDLLCFPSTYEGFGRPIIEANAIGRVVVTSKLEPMMEVANDSAILIDPYNVNSIREGLLMAINDEKIRSDLIKNGYKNAEIYRAKTTANSYCDIYNKILK